MIHPPLFYDLSDAEQGALLLAKHRGLTIEFWDEVGKWVKADDANKWVKADDAKWHNITAYRIAPTPDTIDWSHLAPEWRFAKRDANQMPFLYTAHPDLWSKLTGARARVTTPSFRNKGMPWDQSLIERPENE